MQFRRRTLPFPQRRGQSRWTPKRSLPSHRIRCMHMSPPQCGETRYFSRARRSRERVRQCVLLLWRVITVFYYYLEKTRAVADVLFCYCCCNFRHFGADFIKYHKVYGNIKYIICILTQRLITINEKNFFNNYKLCL